MFLEFLDAQGTLFKLPDRDLHLFREMLMG